MNHIKSRKHPTALVRTSQGMGAAAAVSMAAFAAPAMAQTTAAPQRLPEVRVQTNADVPYKADSVALPKFTQPLVDTPQTITVIRKEIMEQQVATTLTEALRNTPGITLQLGENGNTQTGDSIFMRGFDTSGSIFVDGIRDLGNISRDVFNIEQVEVVKGPSGSDNGRGTSSGYINLVSKTPGLEAFNNGSVSAGTDNRLRATADLNKPLDLSIPGSALRLNLMAQDFGTPGRDYVKSKRVGFAPSIAFGLGTPTRTYFNYLYIDQNNRPDGGVPTYGLPGYIGARGPRVDSENYYGSRSDYDDIKLHMFTARFEHDFAPGTTLRNTTRLGNTEQDYVLTGVNAVTATAANPAAWTVARSRQGRHQTNSIFTNQTNLTTEFQTGALKHSLSTGVELIYERQNQTNGSVVGPAQAAANLYAPSVNDVFRPLTTTGAYTRGSTLSAAAYAFDTIKLSEQWLINGGLRFERFNTETNGATYTAAAGATPASLAQNPQLKVNDNLTSWKLGTVFKPAPNGSVYVTVSNSYQPPGGTNFQLGTGTNNNNPALALTPQKGSNVELGTKWDLLDGKLATTAAIYRAENKNELVSDGLTPATFNQIGKRRVDGVELGAVGQITPALNISAGFAYMDPKIIQGVVNGANANQGGVIVFSPRRTFTSWVTYRLPIGLTIGGGVRYVSPTATSSNQVVTSGVTGTQDYTVVDALLSYPVSKNVSLQLNVNNLFDKNYIASVNNGRSRYIPGVSRNALLTANLKF
ncbi:catecholate siderophore receptor Fiu [Xylophilus sp. GOD-11R]|uniref:catecholate siderophore receptor Fiu n=1 Tax=Xylophilus sp. GOD-11R TaxID=3089814 RepID=UPI00298CA134|nr:catecholate siderophore receptor Fiu [Xylophilus sp. GOD-11R]WPB58462.1 catecholate siderophore receptor Fiu [Xylophilus sp. GOD-11R]